MAVTYGFYDSLNGDRMYNASDMSSLFNGVMSEGVLVTLGEAFIVTQIIDTMNVRVGTGRCWLLNTWTANTTGLTLTVDPAEAVLNRYDAVVVEVNKEVGVRANSIKIIKGTPGSNPAYPTLINTPTILQSVLAYIYVPAASTAVTQANITNMIGVQNGTPISTGLINTISSQSLMAQWDAEFHDWLEHLQDELDANQAANLQAQIDILEDERHGWIRMVDPSYGYVFPYTDGSTGVIPCPNDPWQNFRAGMRLSYTKTRYIDARFLFDGNSINTANPPPIASADTAISYVGGKFGSAASFNGTTSKIAVPTDWRWENLVYPPFAFSMWVKCPTIGGSDMTLFESWNETGNKAGWSLAIEATTGRLKFTTAKNTGTVLEVDYSVNYGSTNIANNTYHFIAVSFMDNYVQIYVDGVLDGSGFAHKPVCLAGGSNYVHFGVHKTAGGYSNYFAGDIDDVAYYNAETLDEDTVLEHYRSLYSPPNQYYSGHYHAIITKVDVHSNGTGAQLTFWGGTDYSYGHKVHIFDVKYSHLKAPVGMNIDPRKWTVYYSDQVLREQTNPVAGTVYNLGGRSILLPVGIWDVSYTTHVYSQHNASIWQAVDSHLSYSSVAVSPYPSEMTGRILGTHLAGSTSYVGAVLRGRGIVQVPLTKTTMYLVYRVDQASQSLKSVVEKAPTFIKATSAYL